MSSSTRNLPETMSCEEIFQAIRDRQITALMFHDQSSDLFDFLGLKGFKRMHEYQYLSESLEHRKLSRYYLNHHNRILGEGYIENPRAIPGDWGKYTRFEVTTNIRRQALEKSFIDYHNWESKTKELYCHYAKRLLDLGHVADFNEVNRLVEDVSLELKYLERMILSLRSISYDPIQIEAMQQELHDHYKCRMKELELL